MASRIGPLAVSDGEKAFMAVLIHYARLNGWLVYHTHRSDRSEPGFPDLVLVRDSRVIFAELKREGGRLTPEQRGWIDSLRAAGHAAYIWFPSSWPGIEKELGMQQHGLSDTTTIGFGGW